MSADKSLAFNRRLSEFIGGGIFSGVFQHPASVLSEKYVE